MRKNEKYSIDFSDKDKQFEVPYNPTVINDYPGAIGAPFNPKPAKDRVVTYNKTNDQDY